MSKTAHFLGQFCQGDKLRGTIVQTASNVKNHPLMIHSSWILQNILKGNYSHKITLDMSLLS